MHSLFLHQTPQTFSDGAELHLQEGEVSVVLHHGDLQVPHHDLTAAVPLLHQVVRVLRVPRHAQDVLRAVADHHWRDKTGSSD